MTVSGITPRQLEELRLWAEKADLASGAAWQAGASRGLLSAAVPVECGGSGLGYEAACLAFEAVAEAAGTGGLPFAMSAHLWAFQTPLAEFGNPEQHAAYLGRAISGDLIGAFAGTEPDAGSDLLSLRTHATRDAAGQWRLTGQKTFVTNGPIADVFLVLARTDGGSAITSLTAFLVPKNAPGLTIGAEIPKGALTGAHFNSVRLDDCAVPNSSLLGGVGGGFAVLMHAMRHERAFILAPALGLMSKSLRDAIRHVTVRTQFGHPLGTYDPIRERVVRMHLSLTSAREALLTTARLADGDRLDHGRASLTKLHVSTEFNNFCGELPDLYGGYAVLPDTEVLGLISDAVASRSYSGTSDMQIKVIAEELGL